MASNSDSPVEMKSKRQPDREPNRIRLLSWNIDGLDKKYTAARTEAVCKTILRYVALNYEIIFLFLSNMIIAYLSWKKMSSQFACSVKNVQLTQMTDLVRFVCNRVFDWPFFSVFYQRVGYAG